MEFVLNFRTEIVISSVMLNTFFEKRERERERASSGTVYFMD